MRNLFRLLTPALVVGVMALGACNAMEGGWEGIKKDLPATTGDVETLRKDHDEALAKIRADFTAADGKIREDQIAQLDAAQTAFKKAISEGKTAAEALVIASEINRTKATDDAGSAAKKALADAADAKTAADKARADAAANGGFVGLLRTIFGKDSVSGILDLAATLLGAGTGTGIAVNVLRNRSRKKALAGKADAPKPPTT